MCRVGIKFDTHGGNGALVIGRLRRVGALAMAMSGALVMAPAHVATNQWHQVTPVMSCLHADVHRRIAL